MCFNHLTAKHLDDHIGYHTIHWIPWCDTMVIPYIGHHKALDETRKALSLHRTVTDLIFPHIRSNLSLFQIFSPAMCGCSLDLWMSRSFPRKPPHFILTSKFKKTTHQAQNASHDYHQATRDPRVPDGRSLVRYTEGSNNYGIYHHYIIGSTFPEFFTDHM